MKTSLGLKDVIICVSTAIYFHYFHPSLIFAGKADAYGISVDVSLKARVFATAIHFHE